MLPEIKSRRVLCAPTGDGEDLTDVDPEQAEAARAYKAQPL